MLSSLFCERLGRRNSPYLNHFIQPDTIVPEQSQGVQAWDRYAYVNNNPIRYNDPSGHCIEPISAVLCGAIAYVGTALYVGVRTVTAQPDGNNASNIWELMKLGVEHADQANITGEGLQSLQSDPSVQDAQDRIVAKIKNYPEYSEQAFTIPDDKAYTQFAANGPSTNFVTGLLTSNPAFLMVHTANLYATNTNVSEDGTISITWKVVDEFDYIPDWNDHNRSSIHYWAYNIGATISAPIYYDLLGAKPKISTTASWEQTIPPPNSCRHCEE